MEIWFLIIVTTCIAFLIKAILSLALNSKAQNWPPGPKGFPIITGLKWIRRSSTEAEAALRSLTAKFGPVVTIQSTRPLIFISSHALAHEALVQKGAIFADRPKPLATAKIMSSNQHNISSAGYGSTWRLLRRNLTSQILHPSKVKEYSQARKWVLNILLTHLKQASSANDGTNGVVKVKDHFQFAMFCLLVLMCFGDKLDESKIKEIEGVQHIQMVNFSRFQVLNFWPRVTRVLLRGRWNELFSIRKKQQEIFIPLIRARKEGLGKGSEDHGGEKNSNTKWVTSYTDTLLSLELQEEDGTKRKLSEEEMVSACSEFLTAGTDTTSTALQWIMANLVKTPEIQAKLYNEIKGVIGEANVEEVGEEELSKMPYLKAVVLEGLRRHPPGHFVLPHAVTQEVELGGHTIPKNAVVNFMVAEMGWDPKVWEDPMEFKPDRFLSNDGSLPEFDITGSREIKMMPFGVGRRICPGFGLAMLHLEYFVANLIWNFKWAAEGEVDLTEKQVFTIVMKNPLQTRISPRVSA